jgi:FHS family L-fucose permease-like MFS transporter
MRINIAQAFNGIGTVVAPVLGSYVFFKNVGEDAQALESVQWVYLAIACFVFILAVVFYFSPVSVDVMCLPCKTLILWPDS